MYWVWCNCVCFAHVSVIVMVPQITVTIFLQLYKHYARRYVSLFIYKIINAKRCCESSYLNANYTRKSLYFRFDYNYDGTYHCGSVSVVSQNQKRKKIHTRERLQCDRGQFNLAKNDAHNTPSNSLTSALSGCFCNYTATCIVKLW